MSTLLITNGLIIDGSGKEPFKGHVLADGERIMAVLHTESAEAGALLARGADHQIDAAGLAISPGFIDAHSHFDWIAPLSEHAEILYPVVEQGITTVITGNCGFSPAPIRAGDSQLLNTFAEFCLERPLDCTWRGMGEFLDNLSAGPLLLNHVQLTGHGTAHLSVCRDISRLPSETEMERMLAMLRESLEEGSFGISLGLMYPPGMFYSQGELTRVVRVAAEEGRILTVHKRALSRYSGAYANIPLLSRPHNLRALKEMLDIGLETGVKLQISHLIFVGRQSWPTAPKAVEMIEQAAARGLQVRWDIYPHFCGNSYLNVFLPPWFMADIEHNLNNPKAIRRVKFELKMAQYLLGFNLADIQIMQAGYPAGEQFNGLDLVEIGRRLSLSPSDALLHLVRMSGGKALQLTYGYSGDGDHEDLISSMMAHPSCLFMTDTILKSAGFANPASYGAFPLILGHFARERRVLPLKDAVAKMSGFTARWFGIKHRGEITPGYFADLAIWNPASIADTTTRAHTASRPAGMEHVFINGKQVVDHGAYLKDSKSGHVLRWEPLNM
jgi:N-acyl-D-amino-acid deacylase